MGRMRKLVAITTGTAAAAALLSATPSAAVAAHAPAPRQAGAAPCAEATESCEGTIRVPLDWSEPDGPTISVAYAWHPRRDRSRPSEGTVLANLAGPTRSIAPTEMYDQVLGSVRDRRDLLLVDPRGHGKSSPLLCENLDPTRPDSVRDCAAELGPRVRHFGSANVAHDIEAVRSALGIDRFSLVGHSGGTVVLPAYAARYPDRVRAMYLSGVFPYAGGYTENPLAGPTSLQAGLADLDLWCRRSAQCRRLPDGSGDRLRELTARLRDRPDPAVSQNLLAMLHVQLAEPTYGRELNAATAAYLAGDRAPLRRLVATVDQTWGRPEPPDPTMAGILGTLCVDGEFPFDRAAEPAEKRRQLAAYYREQRPFRPFHGQDVSFLRDHDYMRGCANWPAAPDTLDTPPLPRDADLSGIPTLIVGGDLDTTTPVAGGRDLAKRISGSTYVEVPGGSHGMTSALPRAPYARCVRRLLRGFLQHPETSVDPPRCDARTTRALGEFPRSTADLPPARSDDLGPRERPLVAAAHATAADAAVRLDPGGIYSPGLDRQRGLRGGLVDYADDRTSAVLEGDRFVDDLATDGSVRLDEEFTATAKLTLTGPDGARHRVELSWPALDAGPARQVTGTVDGRPFEATVPTP